MHVDSRPVNSIKRSIEEATSVLLFATTADTELRKPKLGQQKLSTCK